MPIYGQDNFKESNINYINKDFASLKKSLINYAKAYFPNSYRDFNESSPGMMLLEMNAYVGDVLSFYIDQQYREMLLPLAEERRNVMNLAKMFGYKVKPVVPSYVNLEFSYEVDAMAEDASKVDYTSAPTFDTGLRVRGFDTNIEFQTLDVIDFKISSSLDTQEVSNTNGDSGLATKYMLTRNVRAISATTKTKKFSIGAPEKFKTLVLPELDVIDIISCVDSNGNNWYEVDYLAQDKVPISTHYTEEGRTSAYQNLLTGINESIAVPYSLSYIKTSKRFTRETNINNTTSLIFGNGVLKNGQVVDSGYIDLEQVGVVVAGQANELNQAINPLLGDEYSTLGETPSNTTLTITYRVGGGEDANLPSSQINQVVDGTTLSAGGSIGDLSSNNPHPARGGRDQESIDEIKEHTKAFFSTQNRCVTIEDYEARILNMSSKYGSIAKVYVTRNEGGDIDFDYQSLTENIGLLSENLNNSISQLDSLHQQYLDSINLGTEFDNSVAIQAIVNSISQLEVLQGGILPNINQLASQANSYSLSGINIYVLARSDTGTLVGNPMAGYAMSEVTDNVPQTLMSNIKNYLNNFKILTDTVQILDGYIINFGVFFDVVAEKYADKQEVKLNCISRIKTYFNTRGMQFNQPIYVGQLEYELMGVKGVRSVNHVTISQHKDYHPNGFGEELIQPTWYYSYSSDVDVDGDPTNGISGGFQFDDFNGTDGYNYKYDFENALQDGIIRPPLPSTPAVFELKNSNQNVKGRVR